ncbi:hypothetical protein D6779_09970, partial [Candidatus Parcubacteria bacterium]
MESTVALLVCAGLPIVMVGMSTLLGAIGGKTTVSIYRRLAPDLPPETARRIVRAWSLSFGLAGLIGGIPLGFGFSSFLVGGFTRSAFKSAGTSITVGLFLFNA